MKPNSELFKPVMIEEYNDENGMSEVADEFIQSLSRCEDDIIGSERIGEAVEFFDEDGAVLLVVMMDEGSHRANFEFTLCEKAFDLSLNNIPEEFLSESSVTGG